MLMLRAVELEFGNVGFEERGKPEDPEKNFFNPHITPSPGIEPGPHRWEASDLTTEPSLFREVFSSSTSCKVRNDTGIELNRIRHH